jgi:hypothetical protein
MKGADLSKLLIFGTATIILDGMAISWLAPSSLH